jgi:subtilisin family serine protease
MKVTDRHHPTGFVRFIACVLMAALGIGNLTLWSTSVRAQRRLKRGAEQTLKRKPKVSRELEKYAKPAAGDERRIHVILRLTGPSRKAVAAMLERCGGLVKNDYHRLATCEVELPERAIPELAALDEVSFVSPDREVRASGHISTTTGADLARAQFTGMDGDTLDGSGITIAVLDSGIYSQHQSFRRQKDKKKDDDDDAKQGRVLLDLNFTPEKYKDDRFGHGTHVASLAAGSSHPSQTSAYLGVAPNAHLINLRVLDSAGKGQVSGVLNALEWVMEHRVKYHIRVVNLSLGMPATDSYRDDPLCQAVRRLVDAGIVVVCAAGNNGRDENGNKLYGLIHAPGNEPSAITVGAANTFGTDRRSDDEVTTYSSRGPTRSSWTDENGARHYDNLIKPDLVAPGNKLIAARSERCLLADENPGLAVTGSRKEKKDEKMMYLSGTSAAAPIVAGAVALMLQANPNLTPNLVKAILMYTAQPLAGFNMLEQGAGQLNIEGAVRLAKLVRPDLPAQLPLGAALLIGNAAPAAYTVIAGYSFPWAQGINVGYSFASGLDLITRYQRIYKLGVLVSDGTLIDQGVLVSDLTMMTDGVLVSDHIRISTGAAVNEGAVYFGNGVLISDHIPNLDGYLTDYGVLVSDALVQAQSAKIQGDQTAAMIPEAVEE